MPNRAELSETPEPSAHHAMANDPSGNSVRTTPIASVTPPRSPHAFQAAKRHRRRTGLSRNPIANPSRTSPGRRTRPHAFQEAEGGRHTTGRSRTSIADRRERPPSGHQTADATPRFSRRRDSRRPTPHLSRHSSRTLPISRPDRPGDPTFFKKAGTIDASPYHAAISTRLAANRLRAPACTTSGCSIDPALFKKIGALGTSPDHAAIPTRLAADRQRAPARTSLWRSINPTLFKNTERSMHRIILKSDRLWLQTDYERRLAHRLVDQSTPRFSRTPRGRCTGSSRNPTVSARHPTSSTSPHIARPIDRPHAFQEDRSARPTTGSSRNPTVSGCPPTTSAGPHVSRPFVGASPLGQRTTRSSR